VLSDLSKVTLDIIGLAGFDYTFNALSRADDDPDELNAAFDALFSISQGVTVWGVLQHFFPFLYYVVSPILVTEDSENKFMFSGQPTKNNQKTKHCRAVMDRVGRKLLQEKKAAYAEGQSASSNKSRDLLSLLIRANMSSDASQRISDDDVVARQCLLIQHVDQRNADSLLGIQRSPRSSLPDTRRPRMP
jgi:hypothetical protein